jgi:hypothetical protein
MQKQDWIVLVVAVVLVSVFVKLGPYGERTEISHNKEQCDVARNPAGYKGGALTELSNECK